MGAWFPRFLPAFIFYLWLERKRTWSEVTDSFLKSRKNPPMICVLLRVPLFANSSFPSNSWGANFGYENGHSGESPSNIHSDQSASFCEESGYLSSSLCHFVRNWANGHLLPRAVESKKKKLPLTLLRPSSRTKGVGEWFLNVISSKLVNTPKLHLP